MDKLTVSKDPLRTSWTKWMRIWTQDRNEFIPKGWDIHHLDGDRSNNNPDNLMCVSREMHALIHQALFDVYGKQKDAYAAMILGKKPAQRLSKSEEHKRKIGLAIKGNKRPDVAKRNKEGKIKR